MRGRRVAALVLLAAAFAAAAVLTYLLFVQTAAGQWLDNAMLGGRLSNSPDAIDDSLDVLSAVSVSRLALVGLVVVVIAAVQRRFVLAVGAVVMILAANVTTQVLKHWILERPQLMGVTDPFGYRNSLPSGHATLFMSLALALVLVTPPRYRGLVAILAGAYALYSGTATITVGWHRPSDVVTAYLVAGFWTALAAAVVVLWRGFDVDAATWGVEGWRWPVSAAALLGALGAAGVVISIVGIGVTGVMLVGGGRNIRSGDFGWAYTTGRLASVGLGLLVLAGILYTLRRLRLEQGRRRRLPFVTPVARRRD
ncbi:MAG: phosphatase PAP2 family protein [Anaerolineae bacterium]